MRDATLHLGACAAVACALASTTARADDAQAHLDAAIALGKQERYTAALASLEASYALRPSPRVLYLRGVAQQRLGDARAAVIAFERFLASDGDVDPALARDARERVGKLRRFVERPPPPAESATAPLWFAARDRDDRYVITAGEASCVTPCKLDVPEGPRRVHASGAEELDVLLQVPRGGGRVRVRHAWDGLLVAGVVLTSLGAAMMVGGNVGFLSTLARSEPAGSGGGASGSGVPAATITFGWAVGPATHLAGIIMMATSLSRFGDANRLEPLRFDVAPTAHGGAAQLTYSF